jgi:hypothetical protein
MKIKLEEFNNEVNFIHLIFNKKDKEEFENVLSNQILPGYKVNDYIENKLSKEKIVFSLLRGNLKYDCLIIQIENMFFSCSLYKESVDLKDLYMLSHLMNS